MTNSTHLQRNYNGKPLRTRKDKDGKGAYVYFFNKDGKRKKAVLARWNRAEETDNSNPQD